MDYVQVIIERTRFKLGCNASNYKTEFKLISDPDILSDFRLGLKLRSTLRVRIQ